jgi:hypothetical protein
MMGGGGTDRIDRIITETKSCSNIQKHPEIEVIFTWGPLSQKYNDNMGKAPILKDDTEAALMVYHKLS